MKKLLIVAILASFALPVFAEKNDAESAIYEITEKIDNTENPSPDEIKEIIRTAIVKYNIQPKDGKCTTSTFFCFE